MYGSVVISRLVGWLVGWLVGKEEKATLAGVITSRVELMSMSR